MTRASDHSLGPPTAAPPYSEPGAMSFQISLNSTEVRPTAGRTKSSQSGSQRPHPLEAELALRAA